jgi:hypothetical protein
MATESQTTMLRELSAAGDRERTGALDVEWDGTRASLFFTFGQASHAELERADGRKLVGNDALSALVEELPADFRVAPWRRAKVADDTLRCTTEELMFLFRRDNTITAGNGAKPTATAKRKSKESRRAAGTPTDGVAGDPPQAVVEAAPFHLSGFPLLPLGKALFADQASRVEGLDRAVPHLPDCLIVLDASHARGAVLVAGASVADAVWVDGSVGLLGGDAAVAVFGAGVGSVAAHAIDDPRVVAAVPILWRAPRLWATVPGRSVAVDSLLAGVRSAGSSCALLAAGSDDPGVALFSEGELVAVYTESKPAPVTTKAALGRLLKAPGAQVTLLRTDADASAPLEIGGITFPLLVGDAAPGEELETTVAEAPAAPRGEATVAFADFVPTRVEVDIDALRAELISIAHVWLGKDDAAAVAAAINNARPGVDDFVAAIQEIASLDIPGHENAVMRAMAREMHFRAAEVLCGV